MPKDKDEHTQNKPRGMFVGVVWSCADVKLLLTSLLLLCSFATILQFFPSTSSFPSASVLRSCLSSKLSPPLAPPTIINIPSPPPIPSLPSDQFQPNGAIKRFFNPVGTAAYLFIQMSAYRGGLNSFAVVGLGSKPIHVFAKPKFTCHWLPSNATAVTHGTAFKILPDWGYGRVYTVVVINCTFPYPVAGGGKLFLTATSGGGGDRNYDAEDQVLALEETSNIFNASYYTSPPKYDYLYCGSPLYGNLSPQRVREWIAYHARLFGTRAHFVIYDAGGVHAGVLEVLRPWIEMGVVTLQDVREQERFDGYYHNQFLVVNDCLHRYRFDANWMFFFDLDEFIYLQPRTTLSSLMAELSRYTQFTIEQMPMSGKICLASDANQTSRMWGIEKLVYRDVKRGVRRDRKYAIQPRSAFATGVHMSQNMAGRTLHKTERRIMYYHYHGTISERREPCREFANYTDVLLDRTPYTRDDTMRRLANSVKVYELKTIGTWLRRTRQ